jgi:alpha-L-rhamnosidase
MGTRSYSPQPRLRSFPISFSLAIALIAVGFMALVWGGWKTSSPYLYHVLAQENTIPPPLATHADSARPNTVYLPTIITSNKPLLETGLWIHDQTPKSHEVALFRYTFSLQEEVYATDLAIFADTRYQAWLDGAWLGRGPARFTKTMREYDSYRLGTLPEGKHVLAVLVQWAPNTRRSESSTPVLAARLEGENGRGASLEIAGGTWKVSRSQGWNRDAAPVHSWNLIGPTELLDFRQLPANWRAVGYDDTHWEAPISRLLQPAINTPRSLPPLQSSPVTQTVHSSGLLSPGFFLGEIKMSATTPQTISFALSKPTTVTIETLAKPLTAPLPIGVPPRPPLNADVGVAVDATPLRPHTNTTRPPDVLQFTHMLTTGIHTLAISHTEQITWPLRISKTNMQSLTLPLRQGSHAGRRLLLTDLVPHRQAVTTTGGDGGMTFSFEAAPSYVIIDVGRVVHGRIEADVTGPPGTIIDIGWDERLWNDTRPLPYPGSFHHQWNQTDSWVLDGTTRSLSTIDSRTGRYILIAVWGDAPVLMEHVRVNAERYPAQQRGSFTSSDERLNRIWQTGVDTLRSNMTDAYAAPWRERGQWWGDAFVSDHVNQAAFGETALLRRGLRLMAEGVADDGRPAALAPHGHNNHLLDYGMLWVQSTADYWRLTHDTAPLRDIYPDIQSFLSYLHTLEHPTTRLLDVPAGSWSQTALIDWAAHWERYGQSTALNALYYDSLLDAVRIAEALGDTTNAMIWNRRANDIKQAIHTTLYLPEEGRYLSTIVDDKPYPPSPQSQAWALAYGVVPQGEVQDVADSLLSLLSDDPATPNVEIYGMYWVLEALGRAGRIDDALSVIEMYYGRLLDLGATTWWETFNSHLSYDNALSHGWGGSPTWFLTTHVLGAQRTGPNTWRVKPALRAQTTLSRTVPLSITGSLPLQDGELAISWRQTQQPNSQTTIAIAAPDSSHGTVVLPTEVVAGEIGTVTVNGMAVWKKGETLVDTVTQEEDGIHIAVEGGSPTITLY